MTKRDKFPIAGFHTITTAEETAGYATIDFPISLKLQNALVTYAKVCTTLKKFGSVEFGYKIGTDYSSIMTGYMVPVGRDGLGYNGCYEWVGTFITPYNVDDLYFVVFYPEDTDWLRFRLIYEVLS